jgi:hypothetical protein
LGSRAPEARLLGDYCDREKNIGLFSVSAVTSLCCQTARVGCTKSSYITAFDLATILTPLQPNFEIHHPPNQDLNLTPLVCAPSRPDDSFRSKDLFSLLSLPKINCFASR